MFEKVYGSRTIPHHWKAACGLDVGFSDTGMHRHYSYWAFVAVSAMNSALPGKHFVYRGRAFKGMAIDDQAVEIWKDLIKTREYGTDLRKYPGLTQYLNVPTDYPHERGGIVKQWQMSHEASGVMLTLHLKYGLPFTKLKHYKAEDGVAQWNNLSRCDYMIPNPFKEDELLDDGTYLIGCPAQFYIVDDDQILAPKNEDGLKLMREQVGNWERVQTRVIESGLTEDKPSKINDDSCDALKGLFHYFGQPPTPLTEKEKIMNLIPREVQEARANAVTGVDKLNAMLHYEFEHRLARDQVKPPEERFLDEWE